MKLKKSFNQLRSVLQYAARWSGYRLLSIVITALLFCGANNQLMAASMPIGANDATTSVPVVTSRDQLNADSFLKASAPDANNNQQWTTLDKVGAAIGAVAGLAALSYGGMKAYRYYRGDSEVDTSKRDEADAAKRLALRSPIAGSSSSSETAKRSAKMPSAHEDPEGFTVLATLENDSSGDGGNALPHGASTGWQAKLAACKTGLGALASKAWNLITFKDCWPGGEASAATTATAKPFSEQLTAAHQAQGKAEVAATKAARSWGQFGWDLLTLKQHKPKDYTTERQKAYAAMNLLGKKTKAAMTGFEHDEQWMPHLRDKGMRTEAIKALTPLSSLPQMLDTLDPEVQAMMKESMKAYAGDSEERSRQFAYFLAKNQDELQLHPGHLAAVDEALEKVKAATGSGEDVDQKAQDLFQTMKESIETLWNKDFESAQQRRDTFNREGFEMTPFSNDSLPSRGGNDELLSAATAAASRNTTIYSGRGGAHEDDAYDSNED